MAYIIPSDLARTIQTENLQQIIGNDPSVLSGAILAGEAEAKSYLTQKYDLTDEFKDLNLWNPDVVYNAGDRVYVNGPLFSISSTYVQDDVVSYNGRVYRCMHAVTTPGPFDLYYWNDIGSLNQIYNVKFPAPVFQYNGLYNIGDEVFWYGYTYQAKVQTSTLSHDVALQYRVVANLPYLNVAPNDPQNGFAHWGTGAPFIFSAGTLPTDFNHYNVGDTRDQQMVLYIIDIILYHVHSRIAPRNIPDLRVKRYDDAIKWLRMAANGDVTPALPKIQPHQGNRIRFGGNIKQINTY